MRIRKVNRYYCDFCKKANCSASSIKKHEERCTLNPNRKCGMCAIMDEKQPDMNLLVAILPKDIAAEIQSEGWLSNKNIERVQEALPALREAAENCPACIMAALRQAGIPVPAIKDFNFKNECDEMWAKFNESRREAEEQSCYE